MKKNITLIIALLTVAVQLFAQTKPQFGKAAYYADKFEGRTTSSGEIFSQNLLTAAHKTLPFNTLVKVTNTANNKTVLVKINDRASGTRVIKLTKLAAQKIGMIESGVANVKIEVVGDASMLTTDTNADVQSGESSGNVIFKIKDSSQKQNGFGIQIGSFQSIDNLQNILKQISSQYTNKVIVYVDNEGTTPLYKVIIGPFENRYSAEKAEQQLTRNVKNKNLDSFVIDLSAM